MWPSWITGVQTLEWYFCCHTFSAPLSVIFSLWIELWLYAAVTSTKLSLIAGAAMLFAKSVIHGYVATDFPSLPASRRITARLRCVKSAMHGTPSTVIGVGPAL